MKKICNQNKNKKKKRKSIFNLLCKVLVRLLKVNKKTIYINILYAYIISVYFFYIAII